MDRPKRSATKVANYRTFHLSGDLDETLQGKVSQTISNFEENLNLETTQEEIEGEPSTNKNMSEAEALQKKLEEKRAATKKAAQEAEEMKLRNELEEESLKQQEWELAIKQLKEKREKSMAAHQLKMEEMKKMAAEIEEKEDPSSTVTWLREQLEKLEPGSLARTTEAEEKAKKEQEEKNKMIQNIKDQQAALNKQLAELTGEPSETPQSQGREDQEKWLQQLQAALSTKAEMDPQKAMLRALTTQSNKTLGPGGVNMLRPELANKIATAPPINNSMSEWLANFNKEEEGESLLRLGDMEGELDCRHTKLKSGMLDKSTMNVKQKQIWPQRTWEKTGLKMS